MPKDKRAFVNPLTQPSTLPVLATSTETTTKPQTLPDTEPATLPTTDTSTSTEDGYTPRKRGSEAFEHTHARVTYWLRKSLKKRFERLSREQNKAKSTLLDEAIADLLKKYDL